MSACVDAACGFDLIEEVKLFATAATHRMEARQCVRSTIPEEQRQALREYAVHVQKYYASQGGFNFYL